MAIGVAERRTLKGYEDKIATLKEQVDALTDKLAGLEERRDAAIHDREVAIKESERISREIASKKAEISTIDATIGNKKMEIDRQNTSETARIEGLRQEVRELEYQAKTAKKQAIEADNKAKKCGPKAREYERLEVAARKLELDIEKSKKTLSENESMAAKILLDAEKKLDEAILAKKENEKQFKSLQKYETGLNFYAQRMRKWYQEKGLKLPVEYKPENISKK